MPATLFQTRQLTDNLIINTKLSDMVSQTIKGRVTAGTGDPEDLTSTQVRSILGLSTTDVVQFGNLNAKTFNIAVPTTINDGIDICTITNGSYASCIEIDFCVHDSGFAISKKYVFAAFYDDTSNAWKKLIPLSSSNAYGGNDCELDIRTSANTTTIRFRRTAGSTSGTGRFSVSVGGDPSATTIASSSTTYTAISGLPDYTQTSLTMLGGNVGIGVPVPTAKLHVNGNFVGTDIYLSGSTILATSTGLSAGARLQSISGDTIRLSNWANTSGVTLDVGTSDTLSLRNRLNNASANIIAQSFRTGNGFGVMSSSTGCMIVGSLVPGDTSFIGTSADNTADLGTSTNRWRHAYLGGKITCNTIDFQGATVGTNNWWTILPQDVSGGTFRLSSNNSGLGFTIANSTGIISIDTGLNVGTNLTVGTTTTQSIVKILGDGISSVKSPTISLFANGGREGFITQTGSAFLIGNTSGLANYNDSTLASAANITLSTTGNTTFSGTITANGDVHTLGTAKIGTGAFGGSWSVFTNDSSISASTYALSAHIASGTYLNAPTGKEVTIRIANGDLVRVIAASTTISNTVITPTIKLTTSPTVGQIWTCTNVDGSGSWQAAGSGITWTIVTADGALAANNGYIANKATLLTMSLPTTCAAGTIIRLSGMNAGLWKISQAAGQSIKFGNQSTTTGTGGYLSSVLTYDAVELICIVANTTWMVISSVGNITVV